MNLNQKILWGFVFLSPLFGERGTSAPADLENFHVVSGLVDIPDRAFVEGSARFGGTQPDYKIELDHPELQRLFRFARQVKQSEPDIWQRIDKLNKYIRKRHLVGFTYGNKNLNRVNSHHINTNQDISLGEYSVCRAGVCRENALYLHFALKQAGIENYHGYAQIQRRSWSHNFDLAEDHAFVVAKINGEFWVLDPYYTGFNGYRLRDLMSANGISKASPMSPIAREFVQFRRIIRINNFPKIYVPKTAPIPRTLSIPRWGPRNIEPCSNYYRQLR